MQSHPHVEKIKQSKFSDSKEELKSHRKYIDKSRKINNKAIRKLKEHLHKLGGI